MISETMSARKDLQCIYVNLKKDSKDFKQLKERETKRERVRESD